MLTVQQIDHIIDNTFDINKKNQNGYTLLYIAVSHMRSELYNEKKHVIEKLLDNGADPSIKDDIGESILANVIDEYYNNGNEAYNILSILLKNYVGYIDKDNIITIMKFNSSSNAIAYDLVELLIPYIEDITPILNYARTSVYNEPEIIELLECSL